MEQGFHRAYPHLVSRFHIDLLNGGQRGYRCSMVIPAYILDE